MCPRPQIHHRIQGQRLIFHFNFLATQSQPCERHQAVLRVPSETINATRGGTRPQFINQTSCNARGPLRLVCDCVTRGVKWKISLCPWILRWSFGRGWILATDFWLRPEGCPDWGVIWPFILHPPSWIGHCILPANAVGELPCGSQSPAPTCVVWSRRLRRGSTWKPYFGWVLCF